MPVTTLGEVVGGDGGGAEGGAEGGAGITSNV